MSAGSSTCTGARECTAPIHVHGCYADLDCSACDEPGDAGTGQPAESTGGAPRESETHDARIELRLEVQEKVNQYGNDRDWAKIRDYEIADIAARVYEPALAALAAELAELREALEHATTAGYEQWEHAHYDHCGLLPHKPGQACQWPLPAALSSEARGAPPGLSRGATP